MEGCCPGRNLVQGLASPSENFLPPLPRVYSKMRVNQISFTPFGCGRTNKVITYPSLVLRRWKRSSDEWVWSFFHNNPFAFLDKPELWSQVLCGGGGTPVTAFFPGLWSLLISGWALNTDSRLGMGILPPPRAWDKTEDITGE